MGTVFSFALFPFVGKKTKPKNPQEILQSCFQLIRFLPTLAFFLPFIKKGGHLEESLGHSFFVVVSGGEVGDGYLPLPVILSVICQALPPTPSLKSANV